MKNNAEVYTMIKILKHTVDIENDEVKLEGVTKLILL